MMSSVRPAQTGADSIAHFKVQFLVLRPDGQPVTDQVVSILFGTGGREGGPGGWLHLDARGIGSFPFGRGPLSGLDDVNVLGLSTLAGGEDNSPVTVMTDDGAKPAFAARAFVFMPGANIADQTGYQRRNRPDCLVQARGDRKSRDR